MKIIIDMIPDLLWLKDIGIWDVYRKESGHDYDIEEELDWLQGNLQGWAAFNPETGEVLGFVLALLNDFDFGVVTMLSSIYVLPKYRTKDVDRRLYEAVRAWSKIIGVNKVAVLADNMRVAKWVFRRYKPTRIYTLLVKDI